MSETDRTHTTLTGPTHNTARCSAVGLSRPLGYRKIQVHLLGEPSLPYRLDL